MKTFKITVFTEEYFVRVGIGTTEELNEWLKKMGTEHTMDGVRGRCLHNLDNGNIVIAINGTLGSDIGIATIAHEASHAVDYLSQYIGMKDESGEFRAHIIASILRQTFKKTGMLNKLQKKKCPTKKK